MTSATKTSAEIETAIERLKDALDAAASAEEEQRINLEIDQLEFMLKEARAQ